MRTMSNSKKERPAMIPRYSRCLPVAAVLLLTGAAFLVAACGSSAGAASTAAETATTKAASAGPSGVIAFSGLVDNPMSLTVVDLDYMDLVTITADHAELGATEYSGVRLADIFSAVGVQSDATALAVTSSAGAAIEIPLADVTSDDAMIAIGGDGTLNAVMPGMESKYWVEDVVSMEFK